ncbi:MAG: DMT family transporter [Candidatus Thorarchaeota archaeon]|nr:MAG: DMT family transporter [Candidatus Thorarchaeota archaeon]
MQLGLDAYSIGVLSGLLATLFFGVSNVVYRAMSDDIRVLDINALRIWVSLPLALFVAIIPIRPTIRQRPPESWLPLSFSMIVGIVAGDAMYFMSQIRIGVARAFPIAMSYPLLVYALTALFLGEPVIPMRIGGVVLTVLGVGLIARRQVKDEETRLKGEEGLGIALAFGTALLWAVGDAVFQFGLVNVDPIDGNFVRMLAGSAVLLPVVAMSFRGPRQIPTKRIASLALVTGIFGMGISLLLGTVSVKEIGATATSVLLASAPLFTTPLSIYFLKEKLTRNVAIGTLLTILGVTLVIIFHS